MQTDSHREFGIRLIPVTSLNTSRYGKIAPIQFSSQPIHQGPASRANASSATKWCRYVHPEGQPYSVLTGEFAFAVVTEENIEDTQTEHQILDCLMVVNLELKYHEIQVPSRCELFLELEDDHRSCKYYFVDHIGKALFWLEDLCTEELDIPPAASAKHLEEQLKRLYWVHVEYFPMHHESHEQQFSGLVEDVYNIISHGQADRLTSRTSTFPYTAEKCKQFLKLLSQKRGQRLDGYTLCYAARLAGALMNQRFVSFYGTQSAQLDRLQELYPADVIEHKWLLTVASMLMWGIPRHYMGQLEELYLNEQVYVDHWTHFISTCLTDWTSSLTWSLPVLLASILLTNVRGGTVATSIAPVVSCAVSIASASCLHLRHQPLAESSADAGARYLAFAKWNIVGFIPTSVAFSLPRASYLWGVGLFTAQFLFVAFHSVNRFVALVAGMFIAVVLTFVFCVVHPEEASIASLCASLPSFIPRLYALDDQDESIV